MRTKYALNKLAQYIPGRATAITVLILAGCFVPSSSQAFEIFGFRFFEKPQAETVAVPDPLPYTASLTVIGADGALEKALNQTSQLIQQAGSPPSGEPGLIARALADQEQLLARLYVAGLYGGTIDIRIAGAPLATTVETGSIDRRPGQPVPVTIRIETGPQFRFGAVAIETVPGGGAGPALQSDDNYGLINGAPALSDKILDAEQRIVADLQAQGHALARVADRSIVADHASQRLDVTIAVEPGPVADFGAVSVQGSERTDAAFIVTQANIQSGTRYDPKVLRAAKKRLRALGVFGSVRLIEAQQLDSGNQLPITIEVSERKLHVIGGGATWSSIDGVGLEAYWRHRNLFGRAERLSIEGSVGRLASSGFEDMEYANRIVFTKPGAFGPTTSFSTTLGAKRENPKPYDSRSVYGSLRVSKQQTDALQIAGGTEFAYSREDDALRSDNYALFGVFGEVIYDSRDDILDPTRGIQASFFAEPAYNAETGGMMIFTKGSVSAYQALDEANRFVLAGRAAAGSIFGANLAGIPPSRRYYAGGGGSVRGYAYRNIGPRLGGRVVGGRSFLETSAEVRVRVTETIGLVGFVDAGAAYSDEIPDFSEPLKIGVGLGVRYYSAVGPLRFDFAVPLAPGPGDPDFALYVGLSQAF